MLVMWSIQKFQLYYIFISSYYYRIYRFPSLFAVDTFHHFGPQILKLQIKSPFFTGKICILDYFSQCEFAYNEGRLSSRISRPAYKLTSGYCFIGLLDCSIRIAIQFSGLDCDSQSKVKIGFWIWIVNPVFPFQSKSKKDQIIFH